jgi:hypothetical protein
LLCPRGWENLSSHCYKKTVQPWDTQGNQTAPCPP